MIDSSRTMGPRQTDSAPRPPDHLWVRTRPIPRIPKRPINRLAVRGADEPMNAIQHANGRKNRMSTTASRPPCQVSDARRPWPASSRATPVLASRARVPPDWRIPPSGRGTRLRPGPTGSQARRRTRRQREQSRPVGDEPCQLRRRVGADRPVEQLRHHRHDQCRHLCARRQWHARQRKLCGG